MERTLIGREIRYSGEAWRGLPLVSRTLRIARNPRESMPCTSSTKTEPDSRGVEPGIAASVLVLGVAIAFADRHMSPWPITGLVLLFGACHGYAHGVEIPKSVSPALYTIGFVISTSTL